MLTARSWNIIWIYVASSVLAIVLGEIAFFHGGQTYCCDASSYLDLSAAMARDGLFGFNHQHASLRTYLYPFFLSGIHRLTGADALLTHVFVFHLQLASLLGSALAFAYVLRRRFRSPLLGAGTYAAIVTNPFLVIMSTAMLTDYPSAAVVLSAVACSLYPARSQPSLHLLAAGAGALAGAAMMIRPTNAVVFAVVLGVWGLRAIKREAPFSTLPLILVIGVLPALPQLWNNHRLYGVWEPLILDKLYSVLLVEGMTFFKQGTLIPPAAMHCTNPFYNGAASQADFFLQSPWNYLRTLALHLFSLFDQDFGFAYVTDTHPWYRWPLSIFNFFLVVTAMCGFLALLAHSLRRRRLDTATIVLVATTAPILACIAVYLPTMVDNRFSQPAYPFVSFFAVVGVWKLSVLLRERRLAFAFVGVTMVTIVLLLIKLALWVDLQCPALM